MSQPVTDTAGNGSTKYALLYESAEDVLAKVPAQYAAHTARGDEFHRRGLLLMFGDPQAQGSMAVFTNREAAEEFVREGPFVVNGVVRGWEIRGWSEGLVA